MAKAKKAALVGLDGIIPERETEMLNGVARLARLGELSDISTRF